MLAAAYAPELQALKRELQATLARLGGEPPSSPAQLSDVAASDDASPPRFSRSGQMEAPDVASIGETATTTTASPQGVESTYGQVSRRRQRHTQRRDRPITAWNRRQLMRELAAASSRRRELETQLQQEMQRDQEQQRRTWQQESDQLTAERHHRHQRRRSAMQEAIAELQQQRAEILRQIRLETAADLTVSHNVEQQQHIEGAAVPSVRPIDSAREDVELSDANAVAPETPSSNTTLENQYSIGGVVTLEPFPRLQQASAGLPQHPPVSVTSSRTASELHSLLAYRKPSDALNDVFSLQLKFAETMLKLEKSVQVRDQLLHQGTFSAFPKRSYPRRRDDRRSYQHGAPSAAAESGSSSDSSVSHRDSWSNGSKASLSSSAFSFSSVESTPPPRRRFQTRDPHAPRAIAMDMATPYSVSNGNSPDSGDTTASPGAFSSISPPERRSHTAHSLGEATNSAEPVAPSEQAEQQAEPQSSTPVTNSSNATPTTGSDQKSTASSSKQVRFGQDDAFATPVIARKFNFDNPSIDEDDEDEDEVAGVEQEEKGEVESMLSFMDGSSVSSTELNDASFLRAFERFRREVNPSRRFSSPPFPSSATHAATEAVFAPPSVMHTPIEPLNVAATEAALCTLEKRCPCSSRDEATVSDESAATSQSQEENPGLQDLRDLGPEELQERRRQLCLDIQAESAQLVLRFGAAPEVDAEAHDAESAKTRLLALRQELEVVDERLGAIGRDPAQ